MSTARFTALVVGVAALVAAAAVRLVGNDYFFSAAYTVLQFVVLASAWNILGGFTGYVNFGSAAFFALGVYSSVALNNLFPAPIALCIAAGTGAAALVGVGMGYLTLRLRGVFFAIATLAFSQVLLTFVVNWDFVGGARGAYLVLRHGPPPGFRSNVQWLFAIMAMMAAGSLAVARWVQTSTMGRGLAAIRDDEVAAECAGVPTLRLKLVSTAISGGLMGMAGATFPYFLLYVEPGGVFSLSYAVNSIAMPLIGGMQSWAGPLVGALLVVFVTIAPEGIVGWARRRRASEAPP